ncbi:MAG: hypothetical protein ACLQFI_05555 [Methylocella sp.]|jgi:hypothetical protein
MNEDFLTLDQFPAAKQKVESIFDVKRRLPDQVFIRPCRFNLMCQFDIAMGELLGVLHEHRSPTASDTVLLAVLDPDPIAYFYKHFRKINAFYFKANITEAEYYDIRWRNPGNPTDAIQFNTGIETYIPSSLSWAMWGERSPEIAVIGLDDPALAEALIADKGWWMDAETASNEFASMPYRNQQMPEDIRRALIANYGSRADLEKKLGHKVDYAWEKL